MLALTAVPKAQAYDFSTGSVLYNYTSPQKKGAVVTYASLQDNLYAYTDDVLIPGTVTYGLNTMPVRGVGDHALFNCQFVSSVVIEDGPSYIMDQAFSHCYGMKTLSLPSTLTYIGDYAFEFCEDLTTVTIPAAVEEIGTSVFTFCNGLREIKVEEGNRYFEDADGILYLKGRTMLVQYPAGKDLTEFTIPAGVTVVTDYAFCPAPKLRKISIGPDVGEISSLTFTDCEALEEITVDEANQSNAAIDGVLYDKQLTKLIQYPRALYMDELILPQTVTSVGYMAVASSIGLGSIVLPESLTTISDYAFTGALINSIISNAHTPPTVGLNAFDSSIYQNTILYVDENDIEAYRSAEGWSSFRNIRAKGTSSIDDIAVDRQAVDTSWFDLQGRRIEKPETGIAIRVITYSDGTVSRSKVVL